MIKIGNTKRRKTTIGVLSPGDTFVYEACPTNVLGVVLDPAYTGYFSRRAKELIDYGNSTGFVDLSRNKICFYSNDKEVTPVEIEAIITRE